MAKRKQSDSVRKMRLIILGLSLALIAAVVALTWFTLSREAQNGELQWKVTSTTTTTQKVAGEPEETTAPEADNTDTLTTTGVNGLPYDSEKSDAYAEWDGKYPTAEVVLRKDDSGSWVAYVGEKRAPDCNGLYVNENGWWFVRNGRVDFNYTGIVGNSKGKWYVEKGHANFNYSGAFTANDSGKSYTVIEGKVAEIERY